MNEKEFNEICEMFKFDDPNFDEQKQITQEELDKALDLHERWINKMKGGVKADLRNLDLSGLDFSRRRIEGVDFAESTFDGSNFDACNFDACNFRNANFVNTSMVFADFDEDCCLKGASFCGVNAEHCCMRYLDLRQTHIYHTDFSCARMHGVVFGGVENSNFTDARLDNSIFASEYAKNLNFTNADLDGVMSKYDFNSDSNED